MHLPLPAIPLEPGETPSSSPDQLRTRVDGLATLGATRVVSWSMRPDWERGLRSFAPILPA